VGCEAFVKEKDLVDERCSIHKQKPEIIEEENYFFKLSKYASTIKDKIEPGSGSHNDTIHAGVGCIRQFKKDLPLPFSPGRIDQITWLSANKFKEVSLWGWHGIHP